MASGPTPAGRQQLKFPRVDGRDLDGRDRCLPDDFEGGRNVVLVAFRARHQTLVDSWLPHLAERAEMDPSLRYYEVPCASLAWAPARQFIDGGMASAVNDQEARRRTVTVYGDIRRITESLDIRDTGTITVVVLDADGLVIDSIQGGFSPQAAARLDVALSSTAEPHISDHSNGLQTFPFEFEARFRAPLRAIGVTPSSARVVVGDGRLRCYFGPWTFDTSLDNVADATTSGPYRWYRAIGPRGSFADGGLTFGTTTRVGLCVSVHEPVSGLLPCGVAPHEGVTLTVADPDGLRQVLEAH